MQRNLVGQTLHDFTPTSSSWLNTANLDPSSPSVAALRTAIAASCTSK